MATEKKDQVAEETEDQKTEKSGQEEVKSEKEQKASEPVKEESVQEKPEKPESKPEKKSQESKAKKDKKETQHAEKKQEPAAQETESPETDSVEPKPSESAEQDYFTQTREDLPELKPGDIIRVFYRVIEGGKERIQAYEGTVIAMKNSGISKTITVRKTSFGIAVERIFPLNSKLVQKIEVKRHSKVRRAKLYYLRKLKGKAARLKELR